MIKKALIWNIRSVRTHQAFNRLQMIDRQHQLFLIALMELFQSARQIQMYERKLNMHTVGTNGNGKIWYFISDNVDVEVISDSPQ